MNYRFSFILLVLVAIVGGYVVLFQIQYRGEPERPNPWVYDVTYADIVGVQVTHAGETQSFVKIETGWVFSETGEPVDLDRWGGITLLLAGPRSSRVLEAVVQDASNFGLDPPLSRFELTLKSGSKVVVFTGHKTPDNSNSYAMTPGSTALFTVPADWTDVLTRLVTEPPVLGSSIAS